MSSEHPYSRAEVVRAWVADGWDASQAVEWIDAGWHVTDDWDLEAERDIAAIAVEWRDAGYGPADALSWNLAETGPEEATAWAEAGYSAEDALAVIGHCQVEYNNLDSDEVLQADRPQRWRESGLTTARITLCIRAGISVDEALALPPEDPATDRSLETLTVLRAPAPVQSLSWRL